MRAFTRLWDRICRERYGVEDPKLRRFRYGVQVNSLGPDRAAAREQRAAHRARDARRHAVQERPGPGHAAAGLERGARAAPALGPAVVAAHPAGPRLRVRPARVRRHLRGLGGHRGEDGRAGRGGLGGAGRRGGARRRLRGDRRAQAAAGAQPGRAGAAHRDGRAEGGRRQLLHRDRALAAARRRRDREHPQGRPRVEAEQIADVERWRAGRDDAAVRAALDELRRVADDDGPGGNIMEATIALAHAGGTTGEWAGALREVFGEFRAPDRRQRRGRPARRRAGAGPAAHQGPGRAHGRPAAPAGGQAGARRPLQRGRADRGGGARRRLRGDLPGHPAHAGPDRGGRPRRGRRHRRAVHPVGLAPGAGARRPRPPAAPPAARRRSWSGGIIPPDDAELLLGKGVASVYTPKDYSFDRIMEDLVALAERQRAATPG